MAKRDKPHVKKMMNWFATRLGVGGELSAHELRGTYIDEFPKAIKMIPNNTAIAVLLRADRRFSFRESRGIRLYSLISKSE